MSDMALSKSILHAIRNEEDDEQIEVSVDFTLTVADFRKAIEHGRLKKWTHEQDKEWGDLIVASLIDGVIQADVDDTRLITAPEQLFQ